MDAAAGARDAAAPLASGVGRRKALLLVHGGAAALLLAAAVHPVHGVGVADPQRRRRRRSGGNGGGRRRRRRREVGLGARRRQPAGRRRALVGGRGGVLRRTPLELYRDAGARVEPRVLPRFLGRQSLRAVPPATHNIKKIRLLKFESFTLVNMENRTFNSPKVNTYVVIESKIFFFKFSNHKFKS